MNKKLFYEQPQIGVLHLNTEGLMAKMSGEGYGGEKTDYWNDGDESL